MEEDVKAIGRVLGIPDKTQEDGDEAEVPENRESGEQAREPGEETNSPDAREDGQGPEEEGQTRAPEEKERTRGTEPDAEFAWNGEELAEMTLEQVAAVAGDSETTAEIFVRARGGTPIDCPKCGEKDRTIPAKGRHRGTPAFRCTRCNTVFGVKTDTAMHASKYKPGVWLVGLKLVQDRGANASPRELMELTGTTASAAAGIIDIARREAQKGGDLLENALKVRDRNVAGGRQQEGTESPPDSPRAETRPNPGLQPAAAGGAPDKPVAAMSLACRNWRRARRPARSCSCKPGRRKGSTARSAEARHR